MLGSINYAQLHVLGQEISQANNFAQEEALKACSRGYNILQSVLHEGLCHTLNHILCFFTFGKKKKWTTFYRFDTCQIADEQFPGSCLKYGEVGK